MLDVEEVQRDLEMLEHDPEPRVIKSKKGDGILFNKHIKKVELDLDVMLTDSFSLGRQFWKDHNLLLINSIRRSIVIMNSMFNDIEQVGKVLYEANTDASDVRQLVIRWNRLKKSIYQIQKSIQYPVRRKKK
jgi:hypothetical protein